MIKVLVVDDSALVRKILTEELDGYNDITVVGSAVDPYAARDKIVRLKPDVVTLDIEMPKMDGLSFLAKLMKHYPLPVIVVSSLTPENGENAIRAFELGAVDVICKPHWVSSTPDITRSLVRAVRAAARANVTKRFPPSKIPESLEKPVFGIKTTHKIVALGASTGGPQALEYILTPLPPDFPGIVIVQHMPAHFTAMFAERLNALCRIRVKEASDEDRVVPGQALIAPGGSHMVVERCGAYYQVRVKDGPMVHHQKPSVDVLFQSVARSAGQNAAGVLLTGMGSDGAAGMLEMRQRGVFTIAQDEQTSVVFGMPAEAIRLKAAERVLGLQDIYGAIAQWFS